MKIEYQNITHFDAKCWQGGHPVTESYDHQGGGFICKIMGEKKWGEDNEREEGGKKKKKKEKSRRREEKKRKEKQGKGKENIKVRKTRDRLLLVIYPSEYAVA